MKYCKLSLKRWTRDTPLPVCTGRYSSVENLIITDDVYLDELDNLLSYVPQLRRLSFHLLFGSKNGRTELSSRLLNHLTHISFKIGHIKFDQFAQMFVNIFPTVEVLRLTVQGYNADSAYMDANKWKELILSHILNLRVFDFK